MKTRVLLAALIAASFAFAPAVRAEDAMSKPAATGDKMDKMDKKAMSKSKKKMSKKSDMKKDEMKKDDPSGDGMMKN